MILKTAKINVKTLLISLEHSVRASYVTPLKQQKSLSDPVKYKSLNVPLQDELQTWTSQLRTGQTSIFAIQIRHILYHM